ncbi:TetR/AcrR family transcriptional regulator [Streptomyces sp. CMB-StM0423]|uniref:TetR/AcrR family transcriptional regulator n=1 Tax=Streptomyces sp. CMB-StM0423 TaxID=2059884 RepID=UPI000C6FD364|nr:TetR/AcrR family transcriptional regulator [Streptomyces sp. CMB-StM0423]AUH38958.1 TetR family transcriptional regulator [Streptomyces sp. CMB-StM0423]
MGETGGPRAPRGRPRSERARAAVLAAATELLVAGGVQAVTMEAIAARARVSKSTVYKWWPTRGHVMLDSLAHVTGDPPARPAAGTSLADALAAEAGALVRIVRDTAAGPLVADLAAAAQADPGIRTALDERWVGPRRAACARLLHDAVARGELRPDTDVAAALDQLFAPVYHRLLLGHAPLADDLAATLVRQLLDGLGGGRGRSEEDQ